MYNLKYIKYQYNTVDNYQVSKVKFLLEMWQVSSTFLKINSIHTFKTQYSVFFLVKENIKKCIQCGPFRWLMFYTEITNKKKKIAIYPIHNITKKECLLWTKCFLDIIIQPKQIHQLHRKLKENKL